MSVALLEFNEANSAIASGEPIGVSKDALGGAIERGLENADFTEAVEIDVCDGAAAGDGGGKLKVHVFFDESRSSHRVARGELESRMKEWKESEEPEAPDAQVVEEVLSGVKGPRLVRFHLAVEGARKAVWVPTGSRLQSALTEVAMETKVPKKKKKKEAMAPKAEKAEKAEKAARAAELRAQAVEAERAAEVAREAAREAEEAAEEEAAAERESERKETMEELERARQELERARDEVEGLERKLKQQNDVERRKRKRGEEGRSEEGESRRVAARKEEPPIVMVDDREFQAAMGAHGGAVHHVWVERFERPGPGGVGPVRGAITVLESVYCSRAEAGEADGLLAMLAASTGTDGEVVVKGFTAVKQYDAWMERKKFVKRTIDIDMRCKNTEGPMEPDWYKDTERVWVKRGSAELAALDKLIANERARKWQCPESPRSPVYRPERPSEARKVSTAYYAYAPSPVDDDHDDESNFVD
jgi:hypothetical protein